jgi:hypothetical protein
MLTFKSRVVIEFALLAVRTDSIILIILLATLALPRTIL